MRPGPSLASAFVALFSTSPLLAQWQVVPVSSAPPARTGFTLLPLANGDLLMVGGDAGNPAATEWRWNGAEWTDAGVLLPRRNDPGAARFDGNRYLVHGGSDANGPRTDTWRSDDGVFWSQVTFGTVPPVLTDLSIAEDPATHRPVMVGLDTSGTWQTWFYVFGTGWSAGPQFTAQDADVVTDTVRGEVQLFLGGFPVFEVKRLVGDQWVSVTQNGSGLTVADLAFDARRARTLVLQPFANHAVAEWDGLANFQQQPRSGAFVPPNRTALAYDAGRSEVVMVANENGSMVTSRWFAQPAPFADRFGTGCHPTSFALDLMPGDSPQLGGLHRLLLPSTNVAQLRLLLLGLSHTSYAGQPLPLPIPLGAFGCQLRVEPLVVNTYAGGPALPVLMNLPATPTLLGQRYDAQALAFDLTGVVSATNGLEVQLGLPLPELQQVETFANSLNRDALASGDAWQLGAVQPTLLGGDGRHGSFDATLGIDLGNGVYQWSSDNQTIPAQRTLDGVAAVVTDGRFQFTDFVVPAGITVKFVGSAPVQLRVRGQVDIQGTVDVSAADLPFFVPTGGLAAGQRVSNFNARSPAVTPRQGQPGGVGGPGGGRGGNGGDKCLNAGPIVVNGIPVTDGQPGDTVQVAAGHAYAGQAAGTGGAGSPLTPAAGTAAAANTPILGSIYRGQFSRGGSGGGFAIPGGVPTAPTVPSGIVVGPAGAAGNTFPLLPFPASAPLGYQSLDHFLVGGSGGGGGGSHAYGLIAVGVSIDFYMAGSAGSGGGGALALRAGGNLLVGSSGAILSRGGQGVLICGDNPLTTTQEVVSQSTHFGVSSPGGGGSGGSVLLQGAVGVVVAGQIDTSGGAGSRTGSIGPVTMNVVAQAGAGSPGYYRLESVVSPLMTGTGVPAFQAATNTGVLQDRDRRTGSRSTWYPIGSSVLPAYVRYELLADINGLPVLFSDDPSISPVAANDPNGAVRVRFQGARLDPLTGAVDPASIGPWRSTLAPGGSSVNADRAQALRFDLVLDTSVANVRVLEVRMVWR